MLKEITIYTDGACSGNPGPGGWAAALICGNDEKYLSGGAEMTTNNRMELLGVISALEAIKSENVVITIYSDSQYIVNAYNKNWIDKWKSCGWTRNGAELMNKDLWQRLDALVNKYSCTFVWVKGHAGNKYNEECDKLAVSESRRYANQSQADSRAQTVETDNEPNRGDEPLFAQLTSTVPAVQTGISLRIATELLDEMLKKENMREYGIDRPCGIHSYCEGCEYQALEFPCASSLIRFHQEFKGE